jgi:hypothetical protein
MSNDGFASEKPGLWVETLTVSSPVKIITLPSLLWRSLQFYEISPIFRQAVING